MEYNRPKNPSEVFVGLVVGSISVVVFTVVLVAVKVVRYAVGY